MLIAACLPSNSPGSSVCDGRCHVALGLVLSPRSSLECDHLPGSCFADTEVLGGLGADTAIAGTLSSPMSPRSARPSPRSPPELGPLATARTPQEGRRGRRPSAHASSRKLDAAGSLESLGSPPWQQPGLPCSPGALPEMPASPPPAVTEAVAEYTVSVPAPQLFRVLR